MTARPANAAEWVADVYQRNYWGAPRDQRPWNQLTGEWVERERVIRGGSFLEGPNKLRVSSREHLPPHETARDIGFRCAMNAPIQPGGVSAAPPAKAH